jgi:hypothetical protein
VGAQQLAEPGVIGGRGGGCGSSCHLRRSVNLI